MRIRKGPSRAACLLLVSLLLSAGALHAESAKPDSAKKNYRLYCMGCHRADGSGSPENGIPSMRDKVGHFLRLSEGRAYLSQVPGTLNTPLNDAETAELLNWVVLNIGRSSTPPNFRLYTGDEVRGYRASVPEDIPALRVKLLEQLPEAR